MSERALSYRARRGILDRDEQMALLVMRVSGDRFGKCYYPAVAGVGFSFLRERFSTHVRRDAAARTIDVSLISGPFRRLQNRWRFLPHDQGCCVEFEIDFEFKVGFLDRLLNANFNHAVDKLIRCFDERAQALYGAGSP
jgi:coenzyme Q-binding protein COQ10